MKRFLCLILTLVLLLTGCQIPKNWSYYTAYADMEYTRQDMDAMEAALDAACAAAETAMTLKELENRIWEFYDALDLCYTNYNYSFIQYCIDMTDLYWQEEYAYCAANVSRADAGLDTLYRALAKSPYRAQLEGEDYFGAGFFDAYEGESQWDETFLSYLEQEAALEETYYALCEEASDVEYYSEDFFTGYGQDLAQDKVQGSEFQDLGQGRHGQNGHDAPEDAHGGGGPHQQHHPIDQKGHQKDIDHVAQVHAQNGLELLPNGFHLLFPSLLILILGRCRKSRIRTLLSNTL